MNEIELLLLLFYRQCRNRLHHLRRQSNLKITVVTFFAVFFWTGLFLLFYRGFGFLATRVHHHFVAYIMEYLFSLFYLTLFMMLIFSSAIIAFSALFQSAESRFLITCPLKPENIFAYKFGETLIFSSWAVFFLGLPLGLAYGCHVGASWGYYVILCAAFVPYLIIPAIIGVFLTFIVAVYLQRIKRLLIMLLVALVAVSLLLILYSLVTLKVQSPEYTAVWLQKAMTWLRFSTSPLIPSNWMSGAMMAAARGEYRNALFNSGLLLANALFLFMLLYCSAARFYCQAWSLTASLKSSRTFLRLTWLRQVLFFLKPQTRVFLEKDIKSFLRDSAQWSQFLILLSLLGFYILNLRTLNYDQKSLFWKNIIANLNLMATALTVCTFASRFIYPLLSLEGKRFWVLAVMPISRRAILLGKFIFAVITLSLVSEGLILLSCIMLKVPWLMMINQALSVLAVSVGIAGLSVGLGALYPDFQEDSPSKIISGFGGTLNLVLGLLFVIAVILLQAIPSFYLLHQKSLPFLALLALGAIVLLALVTCLTPLLLGSRHFNQMEITTSMG